MRRISRRIAAITESATPAVDAQAEALRAAVEPDRVLVTNGGGAVHPRALLEQIARWAVEHDLLVVTGDLARAGRADPRRGRGGGGPGRGVRDAGHLRLSSALSDDDLVEGVGRIATLAREAF